MPFPAEYQRATDDFYAFLMTARDEADLGSSHQAYTMTQGVLRCFRRRLSVNDAIRFANALPVGLRALFVAEWNPEEPTRAFESIETMTAEVQALRAGHNFAPDTAIADVARALRHHVDVEKLERLLESFSDNARSFWD